MKWFKRKKKQEEYLEEDVLIPEEPEMPKRPEDVIVDNCEQMIETAKDLEDKKSEYKVVTAYLNDIQLLEDLSEEEAADIKEAAENVVSLGNSRAELLKTEKKLTDVQYLQMEQNEADIPDAIKRLQASEDYQAAVERDMRYLETEKTKWMYNSEGIREEQESLRKLSIGIFSAFVVIFAILLVLQSIFEVNTQLIWMLVIFAAAVGGFFVYKRGKDDEEELKRSELNRNHTIVLLNKMKIKYVNAKNAVDYACEKYHVNNSYELNKVWEEYKEASKEQEKFLRMNEERDFYNAKLIKALRQYRLYDVRVWLDQAQALVDKREMVEVKHELVERRQNLRNTIEEETRSLKEKRKKTERLLAEENPDNRTEIMEILQSIDKLSKIE
ncbi:MAG: hypothetical protein PUB46_08185 [Lachnospiraceae bacterium]|uniref:hypothetical protein n=1 Tax=Roseburia hominis TaxID=301301 RepID=UPI001F188A45|nr:hypothetical protein [Roseburia hominis]MCI5712025.1 hypothetical protein [Lachnospiraceae bacterium]MDD6170042.1 hypothetical protein [Lachnospiraceae bacterium]MDY4840415.1 hypothetical protein [Lachnospiraceae bacterium]